MSNGIPGWSMAAYNLRHLSTEAIEPPLLLFSEQGTHFLRQVRAHVSASKLKNITLDEVDAIPKRSILCTDHRSRRGVGELLPLHLDTMQRAVIRRFECDSGFLADGIVARFRTKLYFPPLRRRQFDILYWLYVLGTNPNDSKLQSDKVSASLIHELIFNSPWLGNDQALCKFIIDLDNATTRDKILRPVQDHLAEADYRKYVSRKHRNPLELNSAQLSAVPDDLGFLTTNWDCDANITIPFSRLPEVAIRIFLWAFFESLESQSSKRRRKKSSSHEPLGSVENWCASRQIGASSIIAKSTTELLTWYALDMTPKSGWPSTVITAFERFEFFGATWKSLTDGFLSVSKVNLKPYLTDQKPIKNVKKANAKRKKTPSPKLKGFTDQENQIIKWRSERKTMTEITAILGTSRNHVYNVWARIKKKSLAMGIVLDPADKFKSRSVRSRQRLPKDY